MAAQYLGIKGVTLYFAFQIFLLKENKYFISGNKKKEVNRKMCKIILINFPLKLCLYFKKELEEQCWAFIDNDELFSEDTAFLLYLEAKKIGNTAVMELMVPRIMKFFLMLVSTKDFLELSVDELCLLLKSNYICVNRYNYKYIFTCYLILIE